MLAADRGDRTAVAAARTLLGEATVATAAFWRGEALAALAEPSESADRPAGGMGPFDGPLSNVGVLAIRIVAALDPQDRDLPKLQAATPALREGLARLQTAREELEAGRTEAAARDARAVAATPALAELGAAQAFLAEALNAARAPDAAAVAKRAIELNPSLVDGWRELGDGELEGGKLKERGDRLPAGRLHGRDVRARLREAGAGAAGAGAHAGGAGGDRRGGRAAAAIRSSSRPSAATSTPRWSATSRRRRPTTRRCAFEPDDHWALHQAALEHGFAGNNSRATELFEAALAHDRDGCHQTLVDYGDHLRRLGRIGDAVKLYRRAVAAVPGDPDWKQTLREAERELLAAPN